MWFLLIRMVVDMLNIKQREIIDLLTTANSKFTRNLISGKSVKNDIEMLIYLFSHSDKN